MSRARNSRKGVVLFLVLATLLIVVLLANIILTILSSQARLTHHQVSRIQALYAGKAAMNYAFEMLRTGVWVPGTNCVVSSGGCNFSDTVFSSAVKQPIKIFITPFGGSGCAISPGNTHCVNIFIDYSYTP